jgi:hypothetical protein
MRIITASSETLMDKGFQKMHNIYCRTEQQNRHAVFSFQKPAGSPKKALKKIQLILS